jgi:hypothetical protein
MPCIFVVDGSGKVPSRLVQRLMAAEYHVLCLADCRIALESLRCLRPDLVIVDVAARSRAAAEGLLNLLGRDNGSDGAGGKPRTARTPVIVVGATPEDYRVLSEMVTNGEVVPAARSSPDEVIQRIAPYVAPSGPPRERRAEVPLAETARAGRSAEWPESPATRRPDVPTTSTRGWQNERR